MDDDDLPKEILALLDQVVELKARLTSTEVFSTLMVLNTTQDYSLSNHKRLLLSINAMRNVSDDSIQFGQILRRVVDYYQPRLEKKIEELGG